MSRKPSPKWDDPEESKRFIDAAAQAEASEHPREFEKALLKVAKSKISDAKPRRG
jgi:hypothetical protein